MDNIERIAIIGLGSIGSAYLSRMLKFVPVESEKVIVLQQEITPKITGSNVKSL